MNSTKTLNYETRPCKFIERMMLLSSLQRICNKFIGSYQYIGFGGVTFTDFKLFHKNLHIDEMHSIEGGKYLHVDRLEYNKPFSLIQIHKESSTNALTKIDIKNKNTIIWLDYDGDLCVEMFEDLKIITNELCVGSLFIMTCNRQLKNEHSNPYSIDEFRRIFGVYSPFDLKSTDFSGSKSHHVISKMYNSFVEKELKNRDKENLFFHQLYNIVYQENRGARMYTFGGIVLDHKHNIADLDLSHFDFISSSKDEVYEINIPNITCLEEQLITKNIDFSESYPLALKNIVSDKDYAKYKRCYKYYPNFIDVRL